MRGQSAEAAHILASNGSGGNYVNLSACCRVLHHIGDSLSLPTPHPYKASCKAFPGINIEGAHLALPKKVDDACRDRTSIRPRQNFVETWRFYVKIHDRYTLPTSRQVESHMHHCRGSTDSTLI
ncbi:hypothetical protein CO2235_230134 [Cupriavidus oxalaticus]|uniref:Uncharacterized protein n=1 Tax=Cupriavidus oxalaticus TaxID=96344 RepID=A0A375G5L0_9BURK|nr:hypothetical protein CO2235_230134 [Cupriavidus oxalaticus]